MKQKQILLGYEVGSGDRIDIQHSHLVVTGVSQESGKTTTLESLINRSDAKAIVFRTKVGERSFLKGTIIPPFFQERSDWEYIKGLIEATMNTRIDKFEQATIIQLTKQTGGKSLVEFKKAVDDAMARTKESSSKMVTLTNLQAYLEKVLPKLQTINFSESLDLVNGLNIVDLERFSRDDEVQALIIASILEEVLYNHKDVIVVIPEAWKFIPQGRGSPCKLALEAFVRQGAANHNYIWVDTQDMAGVDKIPLKQITTWILGYQSEKNEVKHTLEQIPLPKAKKPNPDEIMSLGKGIFYKATREQTVRVYVKPFWLDDERAIRIAKGELKVEELDAPSIALAVNAVMNKDRGQQQPAQTIDIASVQRPLRKEMNDLRTDFFTKAADMQQQILDILTTVNSIRQTPQPVIDEDTIVGKVLQKMPLSMPQVTPGITIDKNEIINEVLKRIPAGGSVTYTVEPIEKLRKDFLEEAKRHIIEKVAKLDVEQRKLLKYIEVQDKGLKVVAMIEKCLFKSTNSDSTRQAVVNKLKAMAADELLRYDKSNSLYYPNLKEAIKTFCVQYGATEDEVKQVYNHIIMSLVET